MSTHTLPLVVGLVRDEGPFYAAHSTLTTMPDVRDVIWLAAPVLLDPLLRWATDAEVPSEHIVLDAAAIAELLFCSTLNTAAELSDDEIRNAIDATLAAYHCHVERCRARHESEAGDYPAETARRYTWCILCASRLLGVEL